MAALAVGGFLASVSVFAPTGGVAAVNAPIPDDGLPPVVIDSPAVVSERTEILDAGVSGMVSGTIDTFPQIDAQVLAFAEYDGRMYVGGKFTRVDFRAGGSVAQPYLAAFDLQTGAWIDSFRPTLDGAVWDLKVLPDGRLAVGGQFTNINGAASTNAIAFIDPITGNATGDQLGIRLTGSSNRPLVRTFDIEGDFLYLGGNFTRVTDNTGNERSVGQIARMRLGNGRIDGAFLPNIGGIVFDVDAHRDRVYVAGNFLYVNNVFSSGLGIVYASNGQLVPDLEPWVRVDSDVNRNYQQAVLAFDDEVWQVGSQHNRQVYRWDDYALIRSWVSDPWGDGQALAELNGVVYSGSHANDETRLYRGALRRPADRSLPSLPVKWMAAFDRSIDEQIEWRPQIGTANGEGSWELFADSTGCLWSGGDFNRGSYDGNTPRFVRGFAKFCSPDRTPPEPPSGPSAVYQDGNGTPRPDGSDAMPFTCLASVPGDADGRFWFDFGNGPFQASVDSDEGGSWILLAQYQHRGGTYPALDVIGVGENWPVESPVSLGTDDSGTARWGHTGQAAASTITDDPDDLELRWFGTTSDHDRVIHFRSPIIGELQTNNELSFVEQGIKDNFTALTGHTGRLPGLANWGLTDRGDRTLTEFPFYNRGDSLDATWAIRGQDWRWEMDSRPVDGEDNTMHQVWVRSNGPDCFDNGAAVDLSWEPSPGDDRGGPVRYEVLKNDRILASFISITTFRDPAGTPDDRYFVRAMDTTGNRSATTRVFTADPGVDTSRPTTPQDLAATIDTDIDPDDVTLTWTAATDNVGVTDYQVLRNNVEIGRTVEPTFLVVDAPQGDSWFQVRAYDAAGNESFKTPPVQVTITLPDLDVAPPSTPQDLVGSVNADGDIELTWTPATDDVGVTEYIVYRNNQIVTTVTEASATYVDPPTGNNYMQVRALDAAGNESFKTPPTMITVAADPAIDTTRPTTPQDLTATQNGTDVTLTWTASTDNVAVTDYQVLRNGTEIGRTTDPTFTWPDATIGTSWFQVRAYDAAGNESFKTPPTQFDVTAEPGADTTNPTTPQNLTGNIVGEQAVLAWEASTDNVGVTSYLVLRNGIQIAETDATTLTATVTANPGGNWYQIRAIDAAGNQSFKTPPLQLDR